MVTETRVRAVGIASQSKDKALAERVQNAMAQAVCDARAAGITDPVETRKAMMAARAKVTGKPVEA